LYPHGPLAILGAVALVPTGAFAACLSPAGDLDASGQANVVDAQCQILMNLWSLTGLVGAYPSCLAAPGSPALVADHDCNGIINVADTVIAVNFAVGIPLGPAVDANENLCVDACEVDLDGDGSIDFNDCGPDNPFVHPGATEACNGYDDDCDGQVDESGAAWSCDDSDVCTGEEGCSPFAAKGVMVSELHAIPTSGSAKAEWLELFNAGAAPVLITGWSLGDGDGPQHVIAPGGALFVPAGGYVVLGGSADPAVNGGARVSYAWGGYGLDDTAQEIVIRNAAGFVVDAVTYGGALAPKKGAALALIDAELDNADPGSWALSKAPYGAGVDLGTPGGANVDATLPPCIAGEPLGCDDGEPCTVDACDAELGCVFVGASGGCDDGDPCTVDACDAGGCTHDALLAFGIACDDGNPCTWPDVCDYAGTCQAGFPVDCDDGDPCTPDVCDGEGGCASEAAAECDDDDPCTVDACLDGACTHDALLAFGTACDDGDPCTWPDVCDYAGACQPGFPTECDDGDACTSAVCDGLGGCAAEPAMDCDDGDPCTVDTCEAGGCTHDALLAFGTDCDDGDPCTWPDVCDYAGTCQPGFPVPDCAP
jgi:hypothetical protein